MPFFKWEGVTRTGQIKSGTREAPNEATLLQFLRSQQIRPRKIQLSKASLSQLTFSFQSGVSDSDLVIFSRQFATMIDAGLPLVQCLDILGSQTTNLAFKKIIKSVQTDVEGGNTFADALRRQPKVFDNLYCQLVKAGEVGGVLDIILQRIASYLEKTLKLKRQVKAAMVYPLVICVVAVVVIWVLMVFVIPIFEKMFVSFGGAQLPMLTQVVTGLSRWMQGYWYLPILAMTGLIFLWKKIRKDPRGQETTDGIFLKLPKFGELLQKVAVARFTRTLGTMVASGVPILEALDITAKAAGNIVIEKAIYRARQSIAEGKTIAQPIADSGVFPPMVCQMISVGEQTGALDTMLTKIADFYEEEVDVTVKGLTSLLEPAMIVILGGIIAVIVMAMYLPIFNLAGSVKVGM